MDEAIVNFYFFLKSCWAFWRLCDGKKPLFLNFFTAEIDNFFAEVVFLSHKINITRSAPAERNELARPANGFWSEFARMIILFDV